MRLSLHKLIKLVICLYVIIIVYVDSIGDPAVKFIRLILVAVMLVYLVKKHSIVLSHYCFWAIIFLIYNFIMIQYAMYKDYAQQYAVSLMYILIVNILICQFLLREEIYDELWIAFIIGAILKATKAFSVNGLFVFLNSRKIENVSANSIGMYCAFSVVFAFMYIQRSKQDSKQNRQLSYLKTGFICWFSVILNCIFVLLSASRKAILFMLIPIVVWLILKSKNSMQILRNVILVCIGIIFIYIALMNVSFLYNFVGHRIESLIQGLLGSVTDKSTNTRLLLIEIGIQWFKQRPIWGYGLLNFKALNIAIRSSDYYAHNNYIELLVDCGLVGTVIYYSLYLKCVWECFKTKNRLDITSIFLFGILISMLVGEIGLVSFFSAPYQLLLLTIVVYTHQHIKKT